MQPLIISSPYSAVSEHVAETQTEESPSGILHPAVFALDLHLEIAREIEVETQTEVASHPVEGEAVIGIRLSHTPAVVGESHQRIYAEPLHQPERKLHVDIQHECRFVVRLKHTSHVGRQSEMLGKLPLEIHVDVSTLVVCGETAHHAHRLLAFPKGMNPQRAYTA